MTWYFLDTSALVKRYHSEVGTEFVDRIFADSGATILISRLSMIEVVSALALKVRTRALAQPDYAIARKRFLGEVKDRRVSVVRFLVGHYRDAERLIDQYARSQRLRTLDALQLAVAIDQSRSGRADHFVTADAALVDIAAAEGLSPRDPMHS